MVECYAPIVVFVFARPEHTRLTLEALAANTLASESELIIYADAARTQSETEPVQQVRKLIRDIKGFRNISIIERETNYGLARSIIEGVSEVCEQYGRVIVLEDDIVTSPAFLSFMNAALDRYADESRVWHISGWNYPIDPKGLGDTFFWRAMNCWGWATWDNHWKYFKKDAQQLIKTWDRQKIKRFNLDGCHDFWRQILNNSTGRQNTWAIFWYASIFEYDGLCLNPTQSFVNNIGIDGSGENCATNKLFIASQLCEKVGELPANYEESMLAVQRIKLFNKSMQETLPQRVYRRIRKFFLRHSDIVLND